ncbi:hypothetical protein [Roseomonas haemaphysalidis]|uniref:OmpA family protein n=1 Tax=Roseomonas haemaphysalidis TaxID=2768162 RepID=A0ABS3KNM1_9PROT|nr:hypothetical protein [Roseomonas haemaphysalidis]MBO1079017.1 hypothetical protein [Roseomonas haemaphysalidis]
MRFRRRAPFRPICPAALAVLLALPAAAWAQAGAPAAVTRRAQPEAPAVTAPAAPAPPDLNRAPRAAAPTPRLPLFALPPSMRNLPQGGWRIEGVSATGRIDPATANTLADIARRLTAQTTGRVTVVAQVDGPADDISVARRAALANAQAVRRALEAGGLDGQRIDLRPVGRTAEGRNAVELLPPGSPSPTLTTQSQTAPAPPSSQQAPPRP